MKMDGLTINIGLMVSDETAEACLRILQIWQENNPKKRIEFRVIDTEVGKKPLFAIREFEE